MVLFDQYARDYDRWYETPPGRFADEVETAALSLFELKQGMSVLDAGCGTGNFSLKLARKGALVTGIDVARGMLKIAETKAVQENLAVEFLLMDIYNLQFPDACFDAVISMAAFEFIEDAGRAFRELMRVVKPGGQILIGTINKDSPWGELYTQQAQDPASVFSHACFKTPADFEKLDPDHLVALRQCLFVPPDAPAELFNWDEEKRLAATAKGGFFVALWRKP